MNKGITKEAMLFTLPPALKEDTSTEALAAATAEALADRLAEIDRLRIISNIDNLEEALLAILARDFKVDWWDPSYSLEEKRRTLKDSWRVHKLLGTKAAVEMAISAIYPHTTVLEWFEYGGEPYHFRLDINITNDSINSVKQRRVLERINFYKNLRSHNDGVTYFVEAGVASIKTGTTAGLLELAAVKIELPIPIRAVVRTGIAAILDEAYTVQLTVPGGRPPGGKALVRMSAVSAHHEHYITKIEEANHGGTE